MRPFIYIASLRRTGSTVLAEALTALPHSYIFIEPLFGENRWSLKESDSDLLSPLGADISALRDQWLASGRSPHATTVLRDQVLPRLGGRVSQIGVKEIRNEGWRCYRNAFPGMKVVLTARDPRDIYVSLYHRQRQGLGTWKGEYTPARVAEDLNTQFRLQMEIRDECDTIAARYEDLATDSGVLTRVRAFVESPISGHGAIGAFLSTAPGREAEHAIHGRSITARQVERWRHEPAEVAVEAAQMIELMVEYCEFWGYH